MLAWVMNMGFAASPAGTPPASSGQPQFLTIMIGIAIRCVVLAILVPLCG